MPTAHAARPTPSGTSTTYAAIVGTGSASRARSIASASCCHGPGSTGCPAIAPSITARSLTSSAASPATARRVSITTRRLAETMRPRPPDQVT
ncbi:hypothetical protein GCM10009661_33590 [Catellatospora chokoriensis]